MDLSLMPSLQKMAAVQIVTRLWNGADVVALIADCDEYLYREKRWREIEEKVKEKISLLRQPAPLGQQLSSFVAPIGDEMRRWKQMHVHGSGMKNVRWTSRGMLDKKGTAEAFVCDSTNHEEARYRMACFYCLEWADPVPLYGDESWPLSGYQAFWTYDRTGDATALDREIGRDPSKTPYRRAFNFAVEWGNVVAAEYYFRKLSPGEREQSLSDVEELLSFYPDFGVYRFLLLHMDEGQRSKLLEAQGERVLECSLRWPWQPLFLDVARLVKDALKSGQYYSLLSQIAYMIKEGYGDYNYRELFGRFWMEIPPNHKKEVMLEFSGWYFPFIGEKNILLQLKDLSPEEREELLLSGTGILACRILARDRRWDFLDVFIRECLSSCDKMMNFKEECRKWPKYFGSPFFEWIDELIEKGSRKEKD